MTDDEVNNNNNQLINVKACVCLFVSVMSKKIIKCSLKLYRLHKFLHWLRTYSFPDMQRQGRRGRGHSSRMIHELWIINRRWLTCPELYLSNCDNITLKRSCEYKTTFVNSYRLPKKKNSTRFLSVGFPHKQRGWEPACGEVTRVDILHYNVYI